MAREGGRDRCWRPKNIEYGMNGCCERHSLQQISWWFCLLTSDGWVLTCPVSLSILFCVLQSSLVLSAADHATQSRLGRGAVAREYSPEARSACCLIPKEYPLTAWPADLPARLPPATPCLRVHDPANMSRLFPTALGNLLFIHGHDLAKKSKSPVRLRSPITTKQQQKTNAIR